MKHFARKIIPFAILIGLITKPFWNKIFGNQILSLVEISEKTHIFWPAFIGVIIFFCLFIYYFIKYIKIRKGVKNKNDSRSEKQFLLLVIVYSIALVFGIIGFIYAQLGLMKLNS